MLVRLILKPIPLVVHLRREASDADSDCRSPHRRNMASPRTVTIVALSFALGLFFVFMGTIKLTPRLSKDAYSEMVSQCASAG